MRATVLTNTENYHSKDIGRNKHLNVPSNVVLEASIKNREQTLSADTDRFGRRTLGDTGPTAGEAEYATHGHIRRANES